jgi:2-C-methyl-D-erythritol 4-phosphate cytidylyltransferase/2-C-methyl-D-erythritol 2,4-cyclodiphosphate synthase
MHVTAIIAAAGEGRRLGGDRPKQFLTIGGVTLVERSARAFEASARVTDLVLVLPAAAAAAPPAWVGRLGKPARVVAGGARRQDSVARGFDAVPAGAEIVVVHDAARPFVTGALIDRTIDAAIETGAAIAAVPAHDTVKQADAAGLVAATLPRETIFLAQTPQAFRRDVLGRAIALGRGGAEATDEAALAEQAGHPVRLVAGEVMNVKITTREDLAKLAPEGTLPPEGGSHRGISVRVGLGYDLHRLAEGRPLVLGGVAIPADRGAVGHSDADAAAHAVTDAVLGAACLGDIGRHFPDTDSRWKGASSLDLLARAVALARDAGLRPANVDVVIVLERPKIAPHLDAIRAGLARALGLEPARVSVKGKTNEGVDAIGRGEALAAHAVAMLVSNE